MCASFVSAETPSGHLGIELALFDPEAMFHGQSADHFVSIDAILVPLTKQAFVLRPFISGLSRGVAADVWVLCDESCRLWRGGNMKGNHGYIRNAPHGKARESPDWDSDMTLFCSRA